jgi:hypothetical protein
MQKTNKNFRSESYVTDVKRAGCFTLSSNGRSSALCISANDFPAVRKVSSHLKEDIRRVTGNYSEIFFDVLPDAGEIILAGTLGKNPFVDLLVSDKKIAISDIAGKREAFLLQVVENPFPGIDKALVIAGSDKRGTVYGMYDLSKRIGVSAWHWWADVPVKKRPELYVLPGRYTIGEPAVQYRGIFINDEAPALMGWVLEKFGAFNHEFYEKVFELVLRMKGNYLWPGMWGKSLFDDDPESFTLADEYGIVIGTSHHEPLMRAHDEWRRYGSGPWNYDKNEKVLREFWKQGIRRMGSRECIVTVGMRGDGDEPMTEGSDIALLERIIADQRSIIAEITKKDPKNVSQMWAVYKEVQDYYDKGMKIPDDILMLLCDDNWGNLRRLPKPEAKKHPGGYGIYYHFDYVGGPRNYKWLNTTQIGRVLEQMQLAYEHEVRGLWIVNVGDIKPVEFPTEFFLDYAWFADRWDHGILADYTKLWATELFGEAHAERIAFMIEEYTKFNSRRKPELLSRDTYSLLNYREAESYVSEYSALADEAEDLLTKLGPEYSDAFHQLVLYPIKACANLNRMYVTLARNFLYASQGRAGTNEAAEEAESLFENDSRLSHYYNKVMANGKWNHMMDQTHISYTYWQQPETDTMPETKRIALSARGEMGVMAEGSSDFFPQTEKELTLEVFDRYNNQNHYIEVFNRGSIPYDYTIAPKDKWIRIEEYTGKVTLVERIFVSIDWKDAPSGTHESEILIKGPGEKSVTVSIVADNPSLATIDGFKGFMESSGYLSIEAEHYSAAINSKGAKWERIPGLGRTLSSMTAYPVTSVSMVPGEDSPRLEYEVFIRKSGELEVSAYVAPTLDYYATGGLKFALSMDDEKPQIVNIHQAEPNTTWEEWVSDNIIIVRSKLKIESAGNHTLKFWMVDPGVVLEKIVIDTGNLKPSYLGPPESIRMQ